MIILSIIFGIAATVCLLLSMKFAVEGNGGFALTAVGFVIFFTLMMYSCLKIGKNTHTTHTIRKVKTVQIDTVITTYKGVSDTTYVIQYTK